MQMVVWKRCMLFLCIVLSFSYAAPEDIGDFDFKKVREAALSTDSEQLSPDVQPTKRENLSNVLIRVSVYLGIIILLILSVAWLLHRNGLKAVRGGGGTMDIIETLPIGQNRMLLMVRVMDEIYFLSQTTTNIALIDKIDGQKALDIIALSNKSNGVITQFKDTLNNFMGKIKKPL